MYIINPAEHSIPNSYINTLWASLKQRLKRFDHGLPTVHIRVLNTLVPVSLEPNKSVFK